MNIYNYKYINKYKNKPLPVARYLNVIDRQRPGYIGCRKFVVCFTIKGVTLSSRSSYMSGSNLKKFRKDPSSWLRSSLNNVWYAPNCDLRLNHSFCQMVLVRLWDWLCRIIHTIDDSSNSFFLFLSLLAILDHTAAILTVNVFKKIFVCKYFSLAINLGGKLANLQDL